MKIAIIGSGISGLYLAYKLQNRHTCIVDIYEKNNYIGGRIKVVDFDDIDVVAGAGILRLNKDKLMLDLCKELNVTTNVYTSNLSYTFNSVSILDFVNQLKKYEITSEIREKYNFSKFAKQVTNDRAYKTFVESCGLSDFEKADIIDTIYNYGFDDCVPGYEAVSVKWKELLTALYNILRNQIQLSTPIKKIEMIDDKFLIKNTIYDKVVIATDIMCIRELMGKTFKIYNDIEGQPFVRLYVKLNRPLQQKGVVVTPEPFQKIIEMNREKCVYMIYCDNKVADKWKRMENRLIKKVIKLNIQRIFGLNVKVLKHKLVYWKTGTHYFKPLKTVYKDRNEFINLAQNPMKNMYVIGEAFSNNQGWTEGALESVNNIIHNI